MSDAMALAERIDRLPADERAILESLLDRLEQGLGSYGPWNINDDRDYEAETLEEVIDALHYSAAGLLRLRRGGAR